MGREGGKLLTGNIWSEGDSHRIVAADITWKEVEDEEPDQIWRRKDAC